MSTDYIFRIEELGQEFNPLVGKKCANLGEMAKIGLRVPPGFALSLDAYRQFMSETGAAKEISKYLNGLNHDFETIDHFNEASAELRKNRRVQGHACGAEGSGPLPLSGNMPEVQ